MPPHAWPHPTRGVSTLSFHLIEWRPHLLVPFWRPNSSSLHAQMALTPTFFSCPLSWPGFQPHHRTNEDTQTASLTSRLLARPPIAKVIFLKCRPGRGSQQHKAACKRKVALLGTTPQALGDQMPDLSRLILDPSHWMANGRSCSALP